MATNRDRDIDMDMDIDMDVEVLELEVCVQGYAWGKVGTASVVGALYHANVEREMSEREREQPYAELWMGSHPNGNAQVKGKVAMGLHQYIQLHPAVLGPTASATAELPYLFKVLSIAKALSIQAHPDKGLATQLHAKDPNTYKDPNHKPEIAVALSTPFEALCSFRPLLQIVQFLEAVPEFRAVLSDAVATAFIQSVNSNTADQKLALKELFASLMNANAQLVGDQLDKLVARIANDTDKLSKLIVRLEKQYPRDVGVFCVYLLNYLELEKGQAIFMGANEPHAYIAGMNAISCG